VSRRKERKQRRRGAPPASDREFRIAKLLAAGWISSADQIPRDAIPVNPDLVNHRNAWGPPKTYYQSEHFHCVDCGHPQEWLPEDQRWYYETTGAIYDIRAVRCRPCRKKEQARKNEARAKLRERLSHLMLSRILLEKATIQDGLDALRRAVAEAKHIPRARLPCLVTLRNPALLSARPFSYAARNVSFLKALATMAEKIHAIAYLTPEHIVIADQDTEPYSVYQSGKRAHAQPLINLQTK
jgi:hypothetical protein